MWLPYCKYCYSHSQHATLEYRPNILCLNIPNTNNSNIYFKSYANSVPETNISTKVSIYAIYDTCLYRYILGYMHVYVSHMKSMSAVYRKNDINTFLFYRVSYKNPNNRLCKPTRMLRFFFFFFFFFERSISCSIN